MENLRFGIKDSFSDTAASTEATSKGTLLTLIKCKKKSSTLQLTVTMYNWRLLLFAFFAVFQPIASFAELNLVDGRQQCCDHRLSRDTGSLNGNYPFKLPVEDHHLNYRREIREVRRNDIRNERSVLTRSPVDGFRDARERQLNRASPDFGSRISRTTLQRINNRVAPAQIRGIHAVRNTEINRDERNFVRDSLSRSTRIAEQQNIKHAEFLSRYTKREINQREVLRQMPRRTAEVRRETRPEPRHTDNDQRSYNERSNVRDFEMKESLTRNHLRQQRLSTPRSAQSSDRSDRDIKEYRAAGRVTDVNSRVSNTRSVNRDNRNEAARNEVRISDRTDRDRKLSSRSLERQRVDSERFYRKLNTVVRDSRADGEMRNYVRDERRIESRNMRENIERLRPTRTVEFRRVDANTERNTERLSPAERSRSINPIRDSRVENRKTVRAALTLTTDEDRREKAVTRRMSTIRSENRQSDNRRERTNLNSRDREIHAIRRNSIDVPQNVMANRGTFSLERRQEQRITRSERENARAFDESRRGDERLGRRVINERALSLERVRLTHAAQRMERAVDQERRFRERATSEASRFSSRKLVSRDMKRYNMSEKNRDNISTRNTERRIVDNSVKSASEFNQNQIDKIENGVEGSNWQYLMYTMQGIYLCTIFLPMLMVKDGAQKKMSLNWGTSLQKLIKAD